MRETELESVAEDKPETNDSVTWVFQAADMYLASGRRKTDYREGKYSVAPLYSYTPRKLWYIKCGGRPRSTN